MDIIKSKNKEIEKLSTSLLEIQEIESVDTTGYKRIGKANSLISQIPNLLSANALSNAYKIVIPPNTSGSLMKLQNGLLSSVMVQDGKIVAHAGLQSFSGLASPMVVFSALSFITGQYFLSEINSSLDSIVSEIKGIRKLLLLEKESVIFSKALFLDELKSRWSTILESDTYRTATLVNVQSSINELSSTIYYLNSVFSDDIADLKESFKEKKFDFESTNSNIQNTIMKISKAYEVRAVLKSMEFILARVASGDNGKEIINILEDEAISFHKSIVDRITQFIDETSLFLKSEAKTIAKQGKVKSLISVLNKTKSDFNFEKPEGILQNTKRSLRQALEVNDSGYEIIMHDGDLYIESD